MKVEGITYEIDWRKFKRGTSIFFPCLDPRRAKGEVMDVLNRLKLDVAGKTCIEDGVRGLRIWRL